MTTLLSNQSLKTNHYPTDQLVKYLHLEAEIDILLQKITTLKQQKELVEKIPTKSQEAILLGAE